MGFRMYVPTRIIFGAGSLNKLSRQKLPGKKALVVISNGKSTRANGYLDRTLEALQQAGAETVVFDQVMANPLKSTVMAGGAFAREQGCDFIVALGGGSVIDASKAIAIVATNDGNIWDYVYGGTGGCQRIGTNPLPVLAITTTAGTGSEVDAFSVITNEETNEKIGLGGDARLFPQTAIVDPELMTSVPPTFTAYQVCEPDERYVCADGDREYRRLSGTCRGKRQGFGSARACCVCQYAVRCGYDDVFLDE